MSYENWCNETYMIMVNSKDGMGMLNNGSEESAIIDWANKNHPDYDANGTHYKWERLTKIADGAWSLDGHSESINHLDMLMGMLG